MVTLTVENLPIWFNNRKPYLNDAPIPFSNCIRFKYIKSARKMAKGIIYKYSDAEVIIERWIKNKNKRRIKYEIWSNK
jgi:hypothetical protein